MKGDVVERKEYAKSAGFFLRSGLAGRRRGQL